MNSTFTFRTAAAAMLFTFCSLVAFAQPTAMSLNQDVSGTYANTSMTLVGAAFKLRVQENAVGTSSGTRNWQFNSDGYSNVWGTTAVAGVQTLAAFNSIIAPNTSTASGNWVVAGYNSNGRLPATLPNNYYTYTIMKGTSYASQRMSVLETSYNPVTISTVTQSAGTYGSRTVTITTSGTPDAAENIFVRYSTNSYTSSTIVQATGSGTTWTATIPWQSAAVNFYVYSSNRSKATIDADVISFATQEVHDLSTLNLNNNGGSNYSWTPTTGTVIVNSSTGSSTSAAYATLKLAFDAINAGTHTGTITIAITANTTEGTTPATLNSSGAGSASYTTLGIAPVTDGVSISGNPITGFGVIQLNGADNVTIDGDNPNTGGTNRNLTINNTAANTVAYNSCIRLATTSSTTVINCDNITIKNCALVGNASSKLSGTSTTGSENASFGILVAGKGGATAITAPTAITSVSNAANAMVTGTTANTFLVDNCSITACARGIAFLGFDAASSTGVTIQNNTIGASGAGSPATPPYTDRKSVV